MPQTRRPLSWFADLLSRVAMLSGIGYLVTSYTFSRWLTRPSRGLPRVTPADLDLPCEDVECTTTDGLRLAGWVVAPCQPRGTVALFHGLRQNRGHTLPRLALLFEAGYRCVVFDHRGHGQSAGRITSFGFHEARDVEAVLDFITAQWPQQPAAALGISMGAAALCFASDRTRRLNACVLESLYHDIASAFHNRIGTRFPTWVRRFMNGVIWVTELRLKAKLKQVTPADHIGKLAPMPILLITGTDDVLAPPEDSERLRQRFGGVCRLVNIPGADHTNLSTKDTQAYQSAVLGFLDEQMVSSKALAA